MSAMLTINKATHDMSGISFVNTSVVYNGQAQYLTITGTLPAGVTVSYTNNSGTNVGNYNAVATFSYDTVNYNAIADMTATLSIKYDTFVFDTDDQNDSRQDVIISVQGGIDPNSNLNVELIEKEVSDEEFKGFLEKGQKVAVAYDVKLLKDGISVQPDGTLKIKVLIPNQLVGKDFGIMHVHNGNQTNMLNYTVEGDYVVFTTDKLSEFVFVYDVGSLMWLIIVLAVIAVVEGGLLAYMMYKNKKSKVYKLNSAYPPFIFGMFIPALHIVLVAVLVAVVVALAIIDVLYAFKWAKAQASANGQVQAQENQDHVEVVEVETAIESEQATVESQDNK